MEKILNAKPFIIAEIGSNWTGFDDCSTSISMAKNAGADAVKFQLFTNKELYGFDIGEESIYSLPREWIPRLKDKAETCHMELMCSAFSKEGYSYVDQFVNYHKVASSNATDHILINHVLGFGKPVFISLGGTSEQDLEFLIKSLKSGWRDRVIWMMCNSVYPSYDHDLEHINILKKKNIGPVGFSDHSLDIICAPKEALNTYGAVAIEKHFKMADEIYGKDDRLTPDCGHSLSIDDFKIMTTHLRRKNIPNLLSGSENPMALRHSVRAIATKNIGAGEMIKFGENWGYHRSLKDDYHGMTPFLFSKMNGKITSKEIAMGDGIAYGDLK